jgi:dipeptidyl-peptidase-4
MRKAFALLVPALVAVAQEDGRLSVERLFHPVDHVTYVEQPIAHYLWDARGGLLEERREKERLTSLRALSLAAPQVRVLAEGPQIAAALETAGADAGDARDALAGSPAWNGACDAFVLRAGRILYHLDLATLKARRLGEGEAPLYSPDGAWVAFLQENDVHAVELATGREVQVTSGGDPRHFNGRMDWVYEEEVFNQRGNPRAFWWSPDSRRIAYLAFDDTQVPLFTLVDDRERDQRVLQVPYPRPGEPNPVVKVGLANMDGQTSWLEDPYPDQETLVAGVGFDPQGRPVASYMNRAQTWLDVRVFDGSSSRTLVSERSRAWIDHPGLPHFLKDGRFLWISSLTGNRHLYLHDAQGRPLTAVTEGPWDVRRLLGVDEATGRAFFEGTARSAVCLDTYRVDLTGGNARLRRLTDAPGTHALTFNRTYTRAVDRFSDVDDPPSDVLLDSDGIVLHRFPAPTTAAFAALKRGKVTFQQVRTRDGFPMETMLVLPPDFNPARKYPVFQYVYGGPGAPLVRNAYGWDILWYHFLAQQGIVTWICDNRSASGKGTAAFGVKGNLGAQELRDQLDGLEWLRAQGWADMSRVALFGYSYGGFLTTYALTHSKAWKLGIAGGPVTDWRLYDSVYTERYMGLLAENGKGYEASSVVGAAPALSGKLLLIHGTLDGNVHPQNTVQFLDALQKAGLDAPMISLPGSDHSPKAQQHRWAMYDGIWNFLKTNL